MANVIRLKRASGSDPAASDLVSGEPAVRTDTGELFFKKDDGSIAKVAGAGGGPDFKYLALRNAANNGAASFPNADFTLVTSGTTSAITPTAANTLLVSVNGVIQKPNTGTSTPSQGFALSGSTIKFGANISAAPDFILYQESGGIGEPSDDTVSEVKLKVSNSPVNGYFLSAQSGNNGGLTWAAPVATSCTGNSATATALATSRTINGTSFDGTANITVTAAAGTLTGNTLNSSVTASSLTSLGDLSGLTVTGNTVGTGKLQYTHTAVSNTAHFLFEATQGGSTNNAGTLFEIKHARGDGNTSPLLDVKNSTGSVFSVAGTGQANIVGNLDITTESSSDSFPVKFIRGGSSVAGYLYSDSVGSGIVGSGKNLNQVGIYMVNNSRMDFRVNGSERVRIDSSGRVRIGCTAQPSTTVSGSQFDAGGKTLRISEGGGTSSTTGASVQITGGGSSTSIGAAAAMGAVLSLTNCNNTDNNQTSIDFMASTGLSTSKVIGKNDNHSSRNGSLIFATSSAAAPAERMRINSSGNVGIQCSNPGSLLELNAAAGTKMGISLGAVGDNITASRYIGICKTADQTDLGVNSGFQGIEFGGPSSTNEGYLAFHTHDFGVESGERLRIDKNGNVGIGQTSPDKPLHIFRASNDAEIRLQTNSGTERNSYISLRESSGDLDFYTVTASNMKFHTSNTERMRIDSSGKVGINVTSPDQALHVIGTGGDTVPVRVESTGTTSRIGFQASGTANSYNVACGAAAEDFAFYTGNTERMRIDSSGDVLIGTTSAVTDTKVVVDGNIAQRNSSTGSNQIVKKFVVSKAYTMSTSAVQVLHLDNWGTSAFEITAFRRDTASPHGAEIQKLYIAVQGSGSNMTDASMVSETKLTKGSIHNVTYSVSDNNNFVVLSATGNDDGGEGQTLTFYIIATGGNDGDVEVQ